MYQLSSGTENPKGDKGNVFIMVCIRFKWPFSERMIETIQVIPPLIMFWRFSKCNISFLVMQMLRFPTDANVGSFKTDFNPGLISIQKLSFRQIKVIFFFHGSSPTIVCSIPDLEGSKKGESEDSRPFDERLCRELVRQLNATLDRKLFIKFVRTYLLDSNSSGNRWMAHALVLQIYRCLLDNFLLVN